jgi:predicted nuclease of predicted toxin-antitoxin system
MKLLFNHHLSPRLANRLAVLFPDSSHVYLHSLDQADDRDVWEFARQHGFTLVTKDSDFNDLSALRGFPPRVLWLRIGNCTTRQIEELIRRHQQVIEEFENDPNAGVLALL